MEDFDYRSILVDSGSIVQCRANNFLMDPNQKENKGQFIQISTRSSVSDNSVSAQKSLKYFLDTNFI